MNAQELFDAAALHLLCQGAKSTGVVDGIEACMLHSTAGLRCSIGCLIPDHIYTTTLEGSSVLDILAAAGGSNKMADRDVRLNARQARFFSEWLPHGDLLYELQCTHDAFPVEEWLSRLKRIAVKHSLRLDVRVPSHA